MKEAEAAEVGSLISAALRAREDEAALAEIATRVNNLATSFPPYPADFRGHV
jgi:glycine/serine hydroxymethyltransferase